eukprot:987077-Amorphochlora_amoeboformis.AAC.1
MGGKGFQDIFQDMRDLRHLPRQNGVHALPTCKHRVHVHVYTTSSHVLSRVANTMHTCGLPPTLGSVGLGFGHDVYVSLVSRCLDDLIVRIMTRTFPPFLAFVPAASLIPMNAPSRPEVFWRLRWSNLSSILRTGTRVNSQRSPRVTFTKVTQGDIHEGHPQ